MERKEGRGGGQLEKGRREGGESWESLRTNEKRSWNAENKGRVSMSFYKSGFHSRMDFRSHHLLRKLSLAKPRARLSAFEVVKLALPPSLSANDQHPLFPPSTRPIRLIPSPITSQPPPDPRNSSHSPSPSLPNASQSRMDHRKSLATSIFESTTYPSEAFDGRTEFEREQDRLINEIANVSLYFPPNSRRKEERRSELAEVLPSPPLSSPR